MDKNERARLSLALAVLFATNILLVLVMTSLPSASAETYREGSTGDTVRQIQTKLKNWGYYNDVVDGIYGPKTAGAVAEFQKRNGLAADGLCGLRTQQAMGIYLSPAGAYALRRDDNAGLLSRLISAEAAAQPYAVQVAVGALALNRVKHPSFPDSLADVIFQPGAFGGVTSGGIDRPPTQTALRAARDALCGADPGRGAVYFDAPVSVGDSAGAGARASVDARGSAGTRAAGGKRERVSTAVLGGVRFYR